MLQESRSDKSVELDSYREVPYLDAIGMARFVCSIRSQPGTKEVTKK
jgi:hypothetical protein